MRLSPLLLMSCMCASALGQETSSEYFRYTSERDEYVAPLSVDVSLFLVPLEGGIDIFTALSNYNFSNVRYRRRGYEDRYTKHYINGIDVYDALASRHDYALLGAMRKIRAAESYRSGLASDGANIGGLCGISQHSVRARDAAVGSRLTISTSDRRYLMAIDVSSSGVSSDEKWAYAVSASRRFGRDSHIEGVFSDDGGFNMSIDRVFKDKSSLTLFATATTALQGLRSASTAEAFSLTGDKLYNPSWGYHDGEVRNSKVSNRLQPLVMASYDAALGENTKLTTTVAYQFGKQSLSGITWQNAQTPQPDYYRYMPDFFANQQLGQTVKKLWLGRDPDVTQINWNEMSVQNDMVIGGQAVYMIENRVSQINNIQFAATASSVINSKITIHYGARLRFDTQHNYKQMKDLLGAEYHTDTDSFLTNEDAYGEPLQSDIRNPDRRVNQGDRFGYDYAIQMSRGSLFGHINYLDQRLRLSCAVELGADRYRRTGNYEKESSGDIDSYGRSASHGFDTYSIKLGAGYSLSPLQNVDIMLMYARESPEFGSLFWSPQYSNRTIERAQSPTTTALEANYNLTLNPLKLKLSVFYTQMQKQSEIYRFYDDISSQQSNMSMTGIDRCHYGIELGADAQVAHGLTIRVGGSVGQYNYASNPRIEMVSEAGLSPILANERAYIDKYRIGGTPQTVATAELRYSGSYSWLATASVNYTAGSYIDMNPMRRMQRANLASAPIEIAKQMANQQRMASSLTVNLFLLKSFKLWGSDFYVIGSVSNLLNRRDIVYSAYEQMRLRKSGSGHQVAIAPFASKYLYAYGRTYFASINYKF